VGRGLRGILVAILLAALGAGCGQGGATRFSGGDVLDPGGGGELSYAIPAEPRGLDPLRAATPSAQTVDRQIFEPLVARVAPPYGGPRLPGLVLGWSHSGDLRVWSLRLRPGVRFQDGEPFNSAAVVANARRWIVDSAGQLAVPGLVAADAPRPALVRLILAQPTPLLPRELADPRLGIVSPAALAPGGADLTRAQQAGTGPYQLRGRAAAVVILERNRGWWGSGAGLGPELDQIAFRAVQDAGERLALLREGAVRVAADLDPAAARSLRGDPLFTAVGAASGHALGLERSVRGIRSARPAPLSGVWLAILHEGGG
jgi:peptide/nickel transport system substrate-binding protein